VFAISRGDVHLVQLDLPEHRTNATEPTFKKAKYVVALQTIQNDAANQVSVVVCSTLQPGRGQRPFEVVAGPADGFDHDTVIDCRWVFTIRTRELSLSTRKTRLSGHVMNQISEALTVGLQL
jgi:mRNA-degrading endonuclease toxin of MazEF toxin-antitoxin module